MTRILAALGLSVLIAGAIPTDSFAQTAKTTKKSTPTKTVKIVNKRTSPTVSLDVRNASLRQALARLFYASKQDFVFEGDIPTGLVTAKIQNQPFETALRLILASSDTPLTYQRSGKVYLISAQRARPARQNVTVAQNVENPVQPVYVDNTVAAANAVPTNYVPPPANAGVQIGPGGVQPAPNNGAFTIGAPLGGLPVVYNPYLGNPFVYNTPPVAYPWANNGFGGSGFYFTVP